MSSTVHMCASNDRARSGTYVAGCATEQSIIKKKSGCALEQSVIEFHFSYFTAISDPIWLCMQLNFDCTCMHLVRSLFLTSRTCDIRMYSKKTISNMVSSFCQDASYHAKVVPEPHLRHIGSSSEQISPVDFS